MTFVMLAVVFVMNGVKVSSATIKLAFICFETDKER